MKRIAWFTFLILATLAGLYFLWLFKEAVVLFSLSLAAAAAARPLVDKITARRIPRAAALLIVYLTTLLVIGFLLAISSGQILSELNDLGNKFAIWYEHAWETWPAGTGLEKTIIHQLPAPNQLYTAIAGSQGQVFAQTFLGVTMSSLAIIGQLTAVLVLSIYWSIDQVRFERLWLSLLPVDRRAQAREVWRDIESGVGAYIRSELVQSILAGIFLWLGLSLVGVPFPALLAIFGAIAWLIPWLGSIIVLIPIVWAGLLVNPFTAIVASILTIIIFLILEIIIEPRIYSRRQYSSLLTILFVIALADAFGLLGIVIAPPLAVAVQILFRHLLSPTSPVSVFEPSEEISDLRTRLMHARELANNLPQEPNLQTANLLSRLDRLIEKAGQMADKPK